MNVSPTPPPNFLKPGIGGVNPTCPQVNTRGENFEAVGDFEKIDLDAKEK